MCIACAVTVAGTGIVIVINKTRVLGLVFAGKKIGECFLGTFFLKNYLFNF